MRLVGPEYVKAIAIDYLQTVVQGMSLHAEMQWERSAHNASTSTVIVVIRGANRRRVAECRVTVRDRADSDSVDGTGSYTKTGA